MAITCRYRSTPAVEPAGEALPRKRSRRVKRRRTGDGRAVESRRIGVTLCAAGVDRAVAASRCGAEESPGSEGQGAR